MKLGPLDSRRLLALALLAVLAGVLLAVTYEVRGKDKPFLSTVIGGGVAFFVGWVVIELMDQWLKLRDADKQR